MRLLTVKDAAAFLSISTSKTYELVETGMLAHHRIGGSIRVSEQQLSAFLEETKREREQTKPRQRNRSRPLRFLR